MAQAAEPPSGTRDFLAGDVRRRRAAFETIGAVFERYGFDPLETPAFERLEVFAGKLGEEASSLIFKILKRGVHEATGEADLALRYDHTVPLARVVGTYGNRLPSPYKRYTIGPVWRADRAAKGRFREFVQCDIDTVGSASPLADAEIVCAVHDGLVALGIRDFQFLVNSRQALRGLLEAYHVDPDLGGKVLGSLDKLDKVQPDAVCAELVERGLTMATAEGLVADVTAPDTDPVRKQLDTTERGRLGLAEVDRLLELTAGLPADRVVFSPRMVRGLDYYTGPIFEVAATGYPGSIASGGRYDGLVAKLGGPDLPACGGSIGVERILAIQAADGTDQRGLDVALTVLGAEDDIMWLAGQIRARGLRTGVYLGSSGKLAKQLKWAHDQHARTALIYGPDEQKVREVTVRNMESGEQTRVPVAEVGAYLHNLHRASARIETLRKHDDDEVKAEKNGSGTYDPDKVEDPARTAAGTTRTSVTDASVLVAELKVTSQWRAAFGSVPRHIFLPSKSWVPDEHGDMIPIDRDQDIERWMGLAYSDIYFVTQVDDGVTSWPDDGKASSSSSMPSVMLTMLDALDVEDRMRVLEIGTGTGYNAALLSHRLGADRVTTVEVDPGVAATAASSLKIAGHPVTVVCGDGAMGYARGAPYDRVLATCAVIGEVPYSWIEQTSPGGLVVAPWGTPYRRSALLRLRVSEHGTACGRFVEGVYLSFMPMRAQRMAYLPDDPENDPDAITTTALSPAELRQTALVFDGSFAIGLRVPQCRTWYETDDEHGYWHTIGFADAESGSFAILNADPNEPDIVIKQWGSRRLWDEVEAAYQWWVSEGRPSHDRFGISVGPGGQSVWLDDPSRPVLTR